jgi:hypothetical protein
MVFGDPIVTPNYEGKEKGEAIPAEVMESVHTQYMDAITALFDKYKASAGYPEATLEIL